MASFQEYKRRAAIPLAGLALGVYFLFVFLPLARHAEDLDAPLQKSWRALAVSLEQSNTLAIDFLQITNQLKETRQALGILQRAKKQAAARLELGAEVRAKLEAPFQLVEYQNERGKQLEELDQIAKQRGVAVDPAVFAGFPEHTADVQQPEILWAELALIHGLLTSAIDCKVTALHSLEAPLALTNPPPDTAVRQLAEIPLQIEFTGPVASVVRLVQTLPLRSDEIHAAGLPEAPADKVPLFIERLVIKKQSPEKPDEVRVFLRVSGFIWRDRVVSVQFD